MIRESLRAGVARIEPPGDLRDRIEARCAITRTANRQPGADRRAIAASALRFLVEALRVEAVCHAAALRGWPSEFQRLEVI
jgi:hypothetical protein